MLNKNYAVVDLETTGTKRKENDRIIQFACSVIENGKITQNINFLINPEKEVSEHIIDLTGITNDQLIGQPVFSDFAKRIIDLLKDKIFVAHNVNFDFPFLNTELTNAGYDPLDIPAIDTVELSQILLPDASSFKLSDLTQYLSIIHNRPHQANSDAFATAKLFLYLKKQLQNLPKPTLETLADLSNNLIRQTGNFIREISQVDQNYERELPQNLIQKKDIILKKPKSMISSKLIKSKYPKNSEKKIQTFAGRIDVRQQQMKMMNFVARKLAQKSKLSLVDAPTGMGKTLGYLFPLSYQLDQGKKAVIATSTKLLQTQLVNESIPLLEQIRERNYSFSVVKSPYNYIDLDNFYHLLHSDYGHRQFNLMKMRILVWLTKTDTGDLTELNLTNYNWDLFKLIRSNGYRISGIFYKYDFWRRIKEQAKYSDILITNHAYLFNNLQELHNNDYLILDEASSLLNDNFDADAKFEIGETNEAIKKISDTIYQQRVFIREYFKDNRVNSWTHNDLSELQTYFDNYDHQIEILKADLMENYVKKQVPLNKRQQFIFLPIEDKFVKQQTLSYLKSVLKSLRDILNKCSKLLNLYNNVHKNAALEMSRLMLHIRIEYLRILGQEQKLDSVIERLGSLTARNGLIISMRNYDNWNSIKLSDHVLVLSNMLKELSKHFKTTILVGAALAYQHSFKNFIQKLDIGNIGRANKIILKRDYSLTNKIKIYVPSDSINPRDDESYEEHIASQVYQITENNDWQTLFMFNSLETLRMVYEQLKLTDLPGKRELLAQNVNGTNAKLQKRFSLNNSAVLLASNAFGEGLNLSAKSLKVLVITRLPFDSPSDPITKLKNNYWKSQGKNPFTNESLPAATRKLKQQIGRLIRNPDDRGVLIFLDNRISEARYGKKMYKELALPPQVKDLDVNTISNNLNIFLSPKV